MFPLVPISVTYCHSSYEPLMLSQTDMSFLKFFFSRLINSNLFTLYFIAYACFSLKPPVTLHHSWYKPQKGRQKFFWGFVNAEKGNRLLPMSCKLTSDRTSQCMPCVHALWQQAQMIFIKDATQPLLLICCVCHWLSAEVSAFKIPILKLPFQMQVLQVVKFFLNSILPSILLANYFNFTQTNLIAQISFVLVKIWNDHMTVSSKEKSKKDLILYILLLKEWATCNYSLKKSTHQFCSSHVSQV